MGLDIRLPIGLMFAVIGILLILAGLVVDSGVYRRSLDININLWWGVVLFVFGGVMLLLGRRGSAAMKPSPTSPEGTAIEQREHETGLESEGTDE